VTELTVALPDELLEVVARRAADILAERQGNEVAGDGFLDVVGASEFLSCPKSRLYSLVSAGRIPHHRDGSRLLFDRAELRTYVHSGGARRP
jgi:excisionase family DNA binding protein